MTERDEKGPEPHEHAAVHAETDRQIAFREWRAYAPDGSIEDAFRQGWSGGWEARGEWARADRSAADSPARETLLRALLARCLPIIQADAQMMADITRHSPLDAASQATHDSTEYESEKLLREIPAALAPDKDPTKNG